MKRGKAGQQNKTAELVNSTGRRPRPPAGYEGREIERAFSADLVAWQRQHGRHDLPWQNTRDAYRIWLSEIMLQQTQVSTVIPYYQRFLERFPDVASLAATDLDEVLRLWSGLGYYSRARNLHAAAKAVMSGHGGRFPDNREALESLPGIGRSTAAAIAAFAYGRREAILDGNVKRVLARCFAVPGYPGDKAVMDRLWTLAESLLPDEGIEAYTQGLMDIGATVCLRKPECQRCPLRGHCMAYQQGNAADYPAPRPKKEVRVRAVGMLVLVNEGKVLLARRPPTGVWANLVLSRTSGRRQCGIVLRRCAGFRTPLNQPTSAVAPRANPLHHGHQPDTGRSGERAAGSSLNRNTMGAAGRSGCMGAPHPHSHFAFTCPGQGPTRLVPVKRPKHENPFPRQREAHDQAGIENQAGIKTCDRIASPLLLGFARSRDESLQNSQSLQSVHLQQLLPRLHGQRQRLRQPVAHPHRVVEGMRLGEYLRPVPLHGQLHQLPAIAVFGGELLRCLFGEKFRFRQHQPLGVAG